MELTPQSLRSPVSPYHQQSKPGYTAQAPCYPNSPLPDSATTSPNQNRGLGLFGYSMPPPSGHVHEMPPSPQPSGSWSCSPVMDHDFPPSSQPPDISSAAFDPFSGFNAAPTTGMPDAPGLAYYQSSSGSHLPSHRSSVSSSYSPSESYSPHGSDFLPTPTVKVEESSEWYYSPSTEPSHGRPMINSDLSPYPPTMSPMSPSVEYSGRDASWSRTYSPAYPAALHDSSVARSSSQGGQVVSSGAGNDAPRKRKPTTSEEATHECEVCGKFFKRSYNYKSHMETHNPQRKYPHPCTAMMGNTRCVKKFQRKTDLDRHYESVCICRFRVCGGGIHTDVKGHRFISRQEIIGVRCVETDSPAGTHSEGAFFSSHFFSQAKRGGGLTAAADFPIQTYRRRMSQTV